MESTPKPPARRHNESIETVPERMNEPDGQTDQDVDTAGTEADESAVGTAVDRGIERDERDRPADGRR
jgi:hypothetical protein